MSAALCARGIASPLKGFSLAAAALMIAAS